MSRSRYFYLVCKKDRKVLDCKGRNIALTPLATCKRDKDKDTQLWTWDSQGRLANKANVSLVADIKQKNKEAGAPIILWPPTGNTNQVWRVEGDLIKSGLNDMAMTGGSRVVMASESNSLEQRWDFVPESLWEEYEQALKQNNPVVEVAFWTKVAECYINVIIGYNIDDYEKEIENAVDMIHDCCNDIEKVAQGTGIARVTGGGVGIAAGLVFMGALFAPITGGISFGFTAAGTFLGVAGGLTTLSSGIAKKVLDDQKKQKVTDIVKPLFNATMCLHGFLNRYYEKFKASREYMDTKEGKAFLKQIFSERKGYWTIEKNFSECGTDVEKIKFVLKSLLDNDFARGGIDLVWTGGTTITRTVAGAAKSISSAGIITAKAFTGTLAAVGIGIGIWEVVNGSSDLKNGSELGREFYKTSHQLEDEAREMVEAYRTLTKRTRKQND